MTDAHPDLVRAREEAVEARRKGVESAGQAMRRRDRLALYVLALTEPGSVLLNAEERIFLINIVNGYAPSRYQESALAILGDMP